MAQAEVLVGIPTYNTNGRLEACLKSIRNITPQAIQEKMVLVGLDDGSPSQSCRDDAEGACIDHNAGFIQHETNMGIPKSWNDLARFAEADIVVLLNDDIEVIHPQWLEAAMAFLTLNPIVGVCGWPTINKRPDTGEYDAANNEASEANLEQPLPTPGACGAPVGCSFAFRQADYYAVDGFWDELISFYEETDFGFRFYDKLGKRNYQLPWPPVVHWHGRTFASNHELGTTVVDGVRVGRMDRSRRMFADKWGCADKLDCPQQELHERYLSDMEAVELSWLTPQGIGTGVAL